LVKRERDRPQGPAPSVNSHIWSTYSTVNSCLRKLFQSLLPPIAGFSSRGPRRWAALCWYRRVGSTPFRQSVGI